MAFQTGTAASHTAFYEIFLSFMQANGWTLRRGETGADTGTTSYKNYWCDVRSTGLSGDDTITGHISLHFNTLLDIYYLRLSGSPSFISSVAVSSPEGQPNSSLLYNAASGSTIAAAVYVPLHRNAMQYWLAGTKRRLVGAILFNERWENFYLGLITPYAFPSQYPYPFLVAGCNRTTGDYKTNTNGCAHPASGVPSGLLWLPGGSWAGYPYTTGEGSGRLGVGGWPYRNSHLPTTFNSGRIIPGNVSGAESFAVLPNIIYSGLGDVSGTFGELDGLAFVSGWGLSAGDTITDSKTGKKYLVVQREKSTANDTCAALLME